VFRKAAKWANEGHMTTSPDSILTSSSSCLVSSNPTQVMEGVWTDHAAVKQRALFQQGTEQDKATSIIAWLGDVTPEQKLGCSNAQSTIYTYIISLQPLVSID